jgi:hypothetical protein
MSTRVFANVMTSAVFYAGLVMLFIIYLLLLLHDETVFPPCILTNINERAPLELFISMDFHWTLAFFYKVHIVSYTVLYVVPRTRGDCTYSVKLVLRRIPYSYIVF